MLFEPGREFLPTGYEAAFRDTVPHAAVNAEPGMTGCRRAFSRSMRKLLSGSLDHRLVTIAQTHTTSRPFRPLCICLPPEIRSPCFTVRACVRAAFCQADISDTMLVLVRGGLQILRIVQEIRSAQTTPPEMEFRVVSFSPTMSSIQVARSSMGFVDHVLRLGHGRKQGD